MTLPGTPLNETREAMVQDLYRLAFYHQLQASAEQSVSKRSADRSLSEAALAEILHEYAAVLQVTDHADDAKLLLGLIEHRSPALAVA
jgi:hypothetical protein